MARHAAWSLGILGALLVATAGDARAEDITVPNVIGLERAEAEARLAEAGFDVAVVAHLAPIHQRRVAGREYPAGTAVEQRPPSYVMVPRGSLIWLSLAAESSGPRHPAPTPVTAAGPSPTAPPAPPSVVVRRTAPVVRTAPTVPVTHKTPPPPATRAAVPAPRTARRTHRLSRARPVPTTRPAPPTAVVTRAPILRKRWELTVEGVLGLFDAPEGPFSRIATGRPDEMTWDALSYSDELLESVRFRAGVRFALTPTDALELRGGWFASLSNRAEASGVFGFTSNPGGTVVVTDPNSATLSGEADLYGGEFSYIRRLFSKCGLYVDVLAGVRYVGFEEEVSATGWAHPFPGGFGSPSVASRVRNDYMAAQVGFLLQKDISRFAQLRLSVKALVGSMAQDIEIQDEAFFSPGVHHATREDREVAFGGELELMLRIPLNRCLAVTGGYSLLVLDGVVRAHDALDFTQAGTGAVQAVSRTDTLLAHMFFAGLSFQF